MTRTYHPGDEPVPGLRLIKFLGQGGIGAVWKATAPGGTEVALKFINLSAARGLKEFSSLRLMKRIRHPNLVPLIAYWLRDSQGRLIEHDTADVGELKRLVTPTTPLQETVDLDEIDAARPVELIVEMGLGDYDLAHRLQQCQQLGLPGIPPAELLDYMSEAAKAIDFLNAPRHELGDGTVGIQHCDIKPFNIMVVGGAVQVCDFGLAHVVGDIRTTSTSSGTIAYVAPECLSTSEPSRGTDQYSLAVTYYELRTGRLPYRSEIFAEVMNAVLRGELDLERLPPAERSVIRRATTVDPAARYGSAGEMVQALRRAASGESPEVVEPAPKDIHRTVSFKLQDTDPDLRQRALDDETWNFDTPVEERPVARQSSWAWVLFLLLVGTSGWIAWTTVQRPPEQPQAPQLAQAQRFIELGQWNQAQPVLDALLQSSESHDDATLAESYLLRGTCHLEQGQISQAEADLSEAIRRRPDDLRGYSRRGKTRLVAKNYESALDDYDKALELEPGADDYFSRGLTLNFMHQYTRALADFAMALRLAPDNVLEIYRTRALTAGAAGDNTLSARDSQVVLLLEAHEQCRSDATWRAKLAEIFELSPDDPAAVTRRALELVESICADTQYREPRLLDLLAQLQAQAGDFESAAKTAAQAVELARGPVQAEYEARQQRYLSRMPHVRGE